MTDEQLFTRVKDDPEALTTLYDRYAEKIYKYVAFRVPHTPDAEDIVSAIFEKLLSQDSTFGFTTSFSAWLHTVAKHKIIDYWRTRKISLPLEVATPGPDARLDDRLDADSKLQTILSQLEESEKSLLILHVLDGYTYREIAQVYGASTDAIKKRFERLKKKCQTYAFE